MKFYHSIHLYAQAIVWLSSIWKICIYILGRKVIGNISILMYTIGYHDFVICLIIKPLLNYYFSILACKVQEISNEQDEICYLDFTTSYFCILGSIMSSQLILKTVKYETTYIIQQTVNIYCISKVCIYQDNT